MFENDFSMLDRYGEDITENQFITNPAIGREQQIGELVLILLTPEKSAILIGKPGIGKTAIVEGLAYRIQQENVPEALKGYSILNVKTASLLGTLPSGESKVQKMIDELKTRDKVILFIDEIHMLIGTTDSSSLDFANIFKEGLGRGSIKVIGATTSDEYERYILRDKAFTRRFQKVEVPEPTPEETAKIMMGTLAKIEKETGVKMRYTPFIQSEIMKFMVDITSEYKRVFSLGSRYPDVSLTLLKQAFSHAVFDNRKELDIFDVKDAIQNSKNIYPSVIKKELARFETIFKDIIKEEQGEETGIEWKQPVAEKKLPPMPIEEGEEYLPFVAVDFTDYSEERKNQKVKKELKLKKDTTPKMIKEADKVLLSGKMSTITVDGIKVAEHRNEYKFPEVDSVKSLPKLENNLNSVNYEKKTVKSYIDDNNTKSLGEKKELGKRPDKIETNMNIGGMPQTIHQNSSLTLKERKDDKFFDDFF